MVPLSPLDPRWGFVCGRVSACEGRLLSEDFFFTLASHVNPEDVLRQLNDTALREYVTPGADWEDWSAVIDRYFHTQVRSIRHDCPRPEVADWFILRDDYQNLKHAVLGDGDYPFPMLNASEEQLASVAKGDASPLPRPFKDAAARAIGVLESTRNRAWVDLALDGAFLRHLLELTDAVDVPLIELYSREYTLARSVFALWRTHRSGHDMRRFQQFALPIGEATPVLNALVAAGDPKNWGDILTGRIGELFREASATPDGEEVPRFEDMTSNYLVEIARQGRGQVAGPERVFCYLRALASEAHNLKLVVCGKLSSIDSTVLKRRLRKKSA